MPNDEVTQETKEEVIKDYLSAIGSRGGRVKSERKAQAARQNAKRPRKHMSSTDNNVANGQNILVAAAKPLC